MAKELEHIARTKSTLYKLLNFPELDWLGRSYVDNLISEQLKICAREFHELTVCHVKTYEASVTGGGVISPLNKYSLPTAKELIKWPLLASDEINYLEAIRQQHKAKPGESNGNTMDPKAYGPTQEWVVWYSHNSPIGDSLSLKSIDNPAKPQSLGGAGSMAICPDQSQPASGPNISGGTKLTPRTVIHRIRAIGPIGLLYLNFPDAVTNHIRLMAGVSVSPLIPVFICRASVIEKFARNS